MRKILFFFCTSVLFQCGFAQFNPVQNLDWDHWYVIGHNYFILSWDEPEPSTDTLTGYNVYQDDDLYMFLTETSLYHTEGSSNAGEDFLLYNGGDPFWMHVTAVYNTAGEESVYLDSAYCYGFAIGSAVQDLADNGWKLYPNPASGYFNLDLRKKSCAELKIYSLNGQILYSTKLRSDENEIDVSDLPRGVCIVSFRQNDNVSFVKLILQ